MKTYLIPTTHIATLHANFSLLSASTPPRVTGEFLQGGEESGNAGDGW